MSMTFLLKSGDGSRERVEGGAGAVDLATVNLIKKLTRNSNVIRGFGMGI